MENSSRIFLKYLGQTVLENSSIDKSLITFIFFKNRVLNQIVLLESSNIGLDEFSNKLYGLCHAPKFSNGRLDEFFINTV